MTKAEWIAWRAGVRAAFADWKMRVRRDWNEVKKAWRAAREGKRAQRGP